MTKVITYIAVLGFSVLLVFSWLDRAQPINVSALGIVEHCMQYSASGTRTAAASPLREYCTIKVNEREVTLRTQDLKEGSTVQLAVLKRPLTGESLYELKSP